MTFLIFFFIQLIAYSLDMGIFFLFTWILGGQPAIANIPGKIITGILSFYLNRRFTFKATAGSGKKQAIKYLIFALINIPVTSGLIVVYLMFVDNAPLAKFMADVTWFILSFWLSKMFIFRVKNSKHNDL